MITVRDQELLIDVIDELSPYEFNRSRNRGTELTACSPFRNEGSPSFSINLETGQWIDFGATGEHMGKGNLVSLLAHLRGESYEDAENYLIGKYGIDLSDIENYELKVVLDDSVQTHKTIPLSDYKRFGYRHPYLTGRGVSERVQRAFKIGFDKSNHAIAIPWFNKAGEIVNIKFRKVNEKAFYYAKGQPIRNHIYGINFVHDMKCERAVLVESEIDALYLWSCGVPALALGGSNFTDAQRRLLLNSPVRELVIASDNDEVGDKVRETITAKLLGSKELFRFPFPDGVKDVNDMKPEQVKTAMENVEKIGFTFL